MVLVRSDVKKKLGEKYWKIFSELIDITVSSVKKAVRKEQQEALESLLIKIKPVKIPPALMGEVREKALQYMIEQGIVSAGLIKELNTFLLNYRRKGLH